MAGFAPQPGGTGPIFLILASLVAPVTHYSALLAPKTQKNWLPSPPPQEYEQALNLFLALSHFYGGLLLTTDDCVRAGIGFIRSGYTDGL